MNVQIKDLIAKLADGLDEAKKPFIGELEQAIESHVAEVVAAAPPKTSPARDDKEEKWNAKTAVSSYASDRGAKQQLYKPAVMPEVPAAPDFSNAFAKSK